MPYKAFDALWYCKLKPNGLYLFPNTFSFTVMPRSMLVVTHCAIEPFAPLTKLH